MTFFNFFKKFHKTLSFGSRSPLSDCFDALERWAISKSSGYVESQLILWGPRYCFSPDNGRPGGGTQKPLTRNDICGLLSLKKEKEEEEEEGAEEERAESGFFFKI